MSTELKRLFAKVDLCLKNRHPARLKITQINRDEAFLLQTQELRFTTYDIKHDRPVAVRAKSQNDGRFIVELVEYVGSLKGEEKK